MQVALGVVSCFADKAMTTLAYSSFSFVFSCVELLVLFFLLIFLKGRQRDRAFRALEL